MWRIIFILLWASLSLASCDNKRTCPLCQGEGEILVEGIMRECIVCKGEKKVDEDTYENFFKALERMHSGGSSTASCSIASDFAAGGPNDGWRRI